MKPNVDEIPTITYTTGSTGDREGEFELFVDHGGRATLVHRAFIHRREWIASLEAGVWDELVEAFRVSGIASSRDVRYTGVPGTLVSRATWQHGESTKSAALGKTPGEIAFKKLAHQLIDQIARGLMELGPWKTDRRLVAESNEVSIGSSGIPPAT